MALILASQNSKKDVDYKICYIRDAKQLSLSDKMDNIPKDVTAEIISKFIEIGKTDQFDLIHKILPANLLLDAGQINRNSYQFWYDIANRLSLDNIIFLIKSLTIAENELHNWGGGSVSGVIWLFRKLMEKEGVSYFGSTSKIAIEMFIDQCQSKNLKSEIIADWILRHSKNPWVPFGSSACRSRSMEELKLEIKEWKSERQRKGEDINKAKNKKQKQFEQIQQNLVTHRKKINERLKIKENLVKLSASGKLNFIIADNEHPIYYYQEELASMNDTELSQIPKEIIVRLLEKFRPTEKGKYHKLKKKFEHYK